MGKTNLKTGYFVPSQNKYKKANDMALAFQNKFWILKVTKLMLSSRF
jgi:hypothetical protein